MATGCFTFLSLYQPIFVDPSELFIYIARVASHDVDGPRMVEA